MQYYLQKNRFNGLEKKYTAKSVNSRSYTFDDIVRDLLDYQTGLSSSVIYGVWEGIKHTIEKRLKEGNSINTELFNVRAGIKGNFESQDDEFSPGRHKIKLNMQPGTVLRRIQNEIKPKKLSPGVITIINSVTDIKSGSVDEILAPGNSIRITGKSVKIAGNDPSCGLYFVSSKTSEQPVKVEISDITVNKPSEIITIVPKLGKGIWKVRVVSQFSKGNKFLKEPKTQTYEKNLTVA